MHDVIMLLKEFRKKAWTIRQTRHPMLFSYLKTKSKILGVDCIYVCAYMILNKTNVIPKCACCDQPCQFFKVKYMFDNMCEEHSKADIKQKRIDLRTKQAIKRSAKRKAAWAIIRDKNKNDG